MLTGLVTDTGLVHLHLRVQRSEDKADEQRLYDVDNLQHDKAKSKSLHVRPCLLVHSVPCA